MILKSFSPGQECPRNSWSRSWRPSPWWGKQRRTATFYISRAAIPHKTGRFFDKSSFLRFKQVPQASDVHSCPGKGRWTCRALWLYIPNTEAPETLRHYTVYIILYSLYIIHYTVLIYMILLFTSYIHYTYRKRQVFTFWLESMNIAMEVPMT